MTRAFIPGVMLVLIVAAVQPCLAVSYTGTLSTSPPNNVELGGTGFWMTDTDPVTSITWTVTQQTEGYWYYQYEFVVQRANVSHFILEVSDGFDVNNPLDFWGLTGSGIDPAKVGVGVYNPGSGNPYMPDDIYGIKFDETTATTVKFDFYSWRSPVWGDFYAKCGAVGGTQNTAWNAGFTTNDTDPSDPPANGSVGYHILRPNDYDPMIPEPGTLALVGLGLAGIALWTRRRRAA